jgi:diguanylate cyclase (GGDEF)-like protein
VSESQTPSHVGSQPRGQSGGPTVDARAEARSDAGSPPGAPPGAPVRGLGRLKALMPRRNSAWAAVMAGLVLIGVLGSVLGARAIARSDGDKSRLAFHLATGEVASTLRLAIQHEEDLVVSASAFFTSQPNASAADFDLWAESVQAMHRYPELQNIGLIKLVEASRLPAFEAYIMANPVRPLGPHSVGPGEGFQILPAGKRPYYCFAVAGLARSFATYLPAGVDYCTISPQLILDREYAQTGYAPFINGDTTTLGVETPLYRGGAVPKTVAARKRAFVGWLGELILQKSVLTRALEGHPNLAVIFRYDSRFSHVAFTSGRAPAGGQTTKVNLLVGREALGNAHEGWTVEVFGAGVAGGVFANLNSLTLLVGGSLLSVMLGLLVLILATGRRRALSLVEEKTRELSHQALHDTLTGLPNRALVLDRAAQLLARGARQPGMLAGALFIDLDGFKYVNDNLGHAAGDQLLKVVADRLQGAVREGDTVGRLSGDEFVVLVESADEATLDLLADRLTEVLHEPIEFDDHCKIFSVTASIGVAVGKYATPDALLRDADLALYAAKAAGKDRYALFDASMYKGVERRIELDADLSAALAQGQFFLHYQPIFDLPTGEVVGVEALIRWAHPQRGVILPDAFIPQAEASGLIVPIGRWVLDEACRQAAAWAADGLATGVSVNVSAHQLGRKEFAEHVRRALAESGIDPAALTLEITETTLMRNVPAACEQLEAIRATGVRVAIDDFGTGYASLSNLQRVPVDILKIDMSFVAALNEGGQSRELLEAIIGVGQALSLAVVAEGIEDQSQMATLQAMGCEMAQGFLMARPGPPELIEGLLRPRAARRTAGSQAV